MEKAQVSTIITKRLSYDRCDEFIKVKYFDENMPISEIKKWMEKLKSEQMDGTDMSNVRIEFMNCE